MTPRIPSVLAVSTFLALLVACPVLAQTSGGASGSAGGSASSGTAGPSRSTGSPSATSPSRAGPTNSTMNNNQGVAPNAAPSLGNSSVPNPSSGTSPGSTAGTPQSGAGVSGTNSQAATSSESINGQGPTKVEPNFRGDNATPTAQDGKPDATQPSTGGIQGMGRRSSTTDTGPYGSSISECVSAFDAANHMSKEQWRESCERTTKR